MKLIILAAGMGTRLMPYTLDKPKCLVELMGKSLLDYQVDIYRDLGVEDVVIVGGYKSECFRGRFQVLINPDYKTTNMVMSLFCASEHLVDDVIISYGDVVHSPNIINSAMNYSGSIGVPIDMRWLDYWKNRFSDVLDDAETLKISKDLIVEIGKKPKNIQEIQAQYMGLIRLNRHGVKIFKDLYNQGLDGRLIQGKHITNAYMTDFLQEIIDMGNPIGAIKCCDDWIEIDSAKDLELKITSDRLINITSSNNFPS